MSPPHGIPYRQKKAVRTSRPMNSAGSSRRQDVGHRRIKSMSSVSADQMMLDCFRRDPNVALGELPDLGSMSMGSSDLLKFEDWQEAFIQVGGDNELMSNMQASQQKVPDASPIGSKFIVVVRP